MLCVAIAVFFCLFVPFVFSLSRIRFVKVLFCVSHGCSGYGHACHFRILWCLIMMVVYLVNLSVVLDSIAF